MDRPCPHTLPNPSQAFPTNPVLPMHGCNMIERAKDLPDGIKRHLLSMLKNQLGNSQFNQITDRIGEEGLLDLWLEQQAHRALSTDKTAARPFETTRCLITACCDFLTCGELAAAWLITLHNVCVSTENDKLYAGIVTLFVFWISLASLSSSMKRGEYTRDIGFAIWTLYALIMILVGVVIAMWGIVQVYL